MSTERQPGVLRSWLFVPGDSERKQAKALGSGADALILDLEDSVDRAQLPEARGRVRALLLAPTRAGRPQLWVRINAPQSGLWREDLAALFGAPGQGSAGSGRQGLVLGLGEDHRPLRHRRRNLHARNQAVAGGSRKHG